MEIDGVKIEWTGHSGFFITCKEGKRIAIDPFNISENVKEKADYIFITHSHFDHCSIKDIEKIKNGKTVIICPADVQSKITRIENVGMEVMEAGDELQLGNIKVEAVPAYNIDKQFHTKKDAWLGYIIKLNGVILYHSGDTDRIPEMEKLTGYGKQGNHFIVFLPVSGKYVMTPEEAADVAIMLSPSIAIPMHYGGEIGTLEDAQRFVKICEQEKIEARILEKI